MLFDKLKYIFFTLVIFLPLDVIAQESTPDSTTFRVFGEIGGGYCYKITEPKIILGTYTRDGFAGTVRFRWGSSNLVAVGIETGWIPISTTKNNSLSSEFGNSNLKATLSAVPVLAIFSMQRFGIQLNTGLGYYRVNATATVFGSTIQSSEWDLGFLAALGFAIPISQDYRIGAEIKLNTISEQQLSIISFQLRFLYRIFGK